MDIHTTDGKVHRVIDMAGQSIPRDTMVSAIQYNDGTWFVLPQPCRWEMLDRVHRAGQKIASAIDDVHAASVLIEKREIGQKLSVAISALYDLLDEIDASDPLLEFRKNSAR